MRSFISNSELPHGAWKRIWAVTSCLVLLVVGGWELALRKSGLEPGFSDNRQLWLSARHRANRNDSDSIILLGASRLQRAVDVDTLSRELGRPVVQLSVEGSSALPLLENLAADPRFRGTVLYSVAPAFSFNRRLSKLDPGLQAEWVRAYNRQSRTQRIEQEIRLCLRGLLSFRSADAAVSRTIPSLLEHGTLPGPGSKTTLRNRQVAIDQSKLEVPATQYGIVNMYRNNSEPYEQRGFAEILHYFRTLVELLNDNGSRLYVLRLPSEGAVLEVERQMFPKQIFWNLLQQNIDAQFIHFEDHPQLQGYLSADGSHVAAEKAAAFTEQLASVLRSNGLQTGAAVQADER